MPNDSAMKALTQQQLDCYLQRIGMVAPETTDQAYLQQLFTAHLYHVPFENLDIALDNGISLSLPDLYHKIVENRRGGFCYELNYMFYQLLTGLGYDAKMLAANVWSKDSYGPDFDHLLLQVSLCDQDFIVDVGFGDSFRTLVPLSGSSVDDGFNRYQLRQQHGFYVLRQTKVKGECFKQYKFTLTPYPISAFNDMCVYQQTSPESHFSTSSVCTIANATGRQTLSNGQLIITKNGQKTRRDISDERDYRQVMLELFGMQLPSHIHPSRFHKLLFVPSTDS
ncbi:arylamine N-acetyltransferase family protein [Thalassotalea sp. HSM 43]|uniref:arylamine N-acetyltransferase family protein n=1 Tax=Thalassotalea sp. HSM 43 TaxID=2552945 RepID=UPI00167C44AF|nr:arylamine N-acetyltransferase [Thalassotalea sp. HSM 43]